MAMQSMVNCVEREEVFFDSVDYLSAEYSSVDRVFGYEFWMNEPKSVKERRDTFFREMGLVELGSSFESSDARSMEMGLDRMVERGEAVLNSCSSSSNDFGEEDLGFCGRECDGDANVVNDESVHEEPIRQSIDVCEYDVGISPHKGHRVNKKLGQWWKEMIRKRKAMIGRCKCEEEKGDSKKFETSRTKVKVNKKRFKELGAMFEAQEIRAHEGVIWAMKFSPDGQFLATGGQDGVVRVWSVKSIDACIERFSDEPSSKRDKKGGFGREKKVKVPVVIPDKVFHIDELPMQEFHGHEGDVLDLAWSKSNCLISSSTDKTVRIWRIGSDECLNIYHHTDYVTCVQFNPIDNSYFISGSIDGKVRIWGVSKRRVVDWADVGDAITALCYQPDGQGFVVGSLRGSCCFYEAKGDLVELSEHILIHSSKRSSTNRVTGIQFCPEDSQKVIVMFEDSKLRILDKMDVVSKYKALPKSGSQMSASFTSDGRHIISVGEDSRVYLWNHEDPFIWSSSHNKSIRSCEYFTSDSVSVAVPWSGSETGLKVSSTLSRVEEAVSRNRDARSFSLGNLFSSKSSATWPEDMLPIFSPARSSAQAQGPDHEALPPTWGLVIVTASWDGVIRAFHNYGLPVGV